MENYLLKLGRFLLYNYFESASAVGIILMVLYMAGEWRILEKSSLKGW